MKIYIDGELPKDCIDCPCFRNDIEICCGLDDGTKDYHNFVEDSNCPLEATQSLKQQVKEEVVEEIKEKFNDTIKHHFCQNPSSVDFITLCISEVEEFLDQVKGENNEN